MVHLGVRAVQYVTGSLRGVTELPDRYFDHPRPEACEATGDGGRLAGETAETQQIQAKLRDASASSRIDCRKLWMITGLKAFSSKWPLAPAMVIVT